MMTPWGYELDAVDPILSVNEFNQLTGGAHASDPRVASALAAASQVIRNYCGWHISPSMACTYRTGGEGKVLRLPACYVSAIQSISEQDKTLVAWTDYEWRQDGLVRRTGHKRWSPRWNAVTVQYTAGYDTDAVPDLVNAVLSIVEGTLNVCAGVSSESADGVTVAYRDNMASVAQALTYQQKGALAPYKVVNAHAM